MEEFYLKSDVVPDLIRAKFTIPLGIKIRFKLLSKGDKLSIYELYEDVADKRYLGTAEVFHPKKSTVVVISSFNINPESHMQWYNSKLNET